MARVNKPQLTNYSNIYEVQNSTNKKEYIATWTQNGRQYPQKNLTKLFGATTAKQAADKLNEIKVLIARGEDPFAKDNKSDLKKSFTDLVLDEIKNRDGSKDYKYIQEKIYMKHIAPVIGKKKLEQIDMITIHDLFNRLQKTESPDTIINLKKTINPTLDYAVDEGLIDKNPLNARKVKKLTKKSKAKGKVPLKHRLVGLDDSRYIETARQLYNAALNFTKENVGITQGKIPDKELQIAFLFVIMTGRRRSEMLKVKYSDITPYGTVKTRFETTKTGVLEEYPLPKEVLDRLDKKKEGYIVPSLTANTYGDYFRKLIDKLELPLHDDMKIRGHDTRNLFLTIMSKETKNPFLCDTALSHSTSQYKMLLTYYEPDLQDYIELFEHYWDLLRGKRNLSK